jgi:hypothetical protein
MSGLAWRHTGSNGENVDTDEEGNLGASVGDEFPGTTGDNEDVSNTTNDDTPENHVVAAKSRVGEISNNKGETVGQQTERLGGGILLDKQPVSN